MSLLIAFFGYTLLALTNILDKLIVTKAVKPVVFLFYGSIFTLPLFILLFFNPIFPRTSVEWALSIFSALSFCGALFTMYVAFLKANIARSGALIGAVTALVTLGLSQWWLQEAISTRQLWGIILMTGACLIIFFEKKREHISFSTSLIWAILAGICFALSHTTAKFIYNELSFTGGLLWTKGTIGICGLILLLIPRVQKEIFSKPKLSSNSPAPSLVLITVNRISGALGTGLVQYAIALGSVAIVNALQGLQYALLMIGVWVLSKFKSNILRENYSKLEILQEILAVILIGVGLWLVV